MTRPLRAVRVGQPGALRPQPTRRRRPNPRPLPESLRWVAPQHQRPRYDAATTAVLAAVGLHAVVAALAFVWPSSNDDRAGDDTPLEVAIVTPEPVAPEPVPEPEPVEAPEVVAEKPAPKPKTLSEPPPEPPTPADEAPPPDVDPLPDTPKPVRRIVGLSLGSTVVGGEGGSFAVGNTAMGRTGATAEKPSEVPQASSRATGTNTAARFVPTAIRTRTPPRPLDGARKAEYPEILKAQGVEANVTVRVTIDRTGKVRAVDIIEAAPYPEFNEAAKKAAFTHRYAPATVDGEQVEDELTYTYRFRIDDA